MRPVILAGPTASGKSELALRIAERDGGCVINADALQVYGCWRILTARPDTAQTRRAPHALYGHVSCERRYSVGAWLADMRRVLRDLGARRPVIVGGTGLYLAALTEGLAMVPEISEAVRSEARARLDAGGLARLVEELARDDPETLDRIDADNPVRVQRAWEVLRTTGRGLSRWQSDAAPPLLPQEDCVCRVLLPERSVLNARIEARFDTMLEEGALAEVAAFAASGIPLTLPAAKALGARELAACLAGECSLETARARALTATRQFAKRQRTWFRSRMAGWERLDPLAGGDLPGAIPCR